MKNSHANDHSCHHLLLVIFITILPFSISQLNPSETRTLFQIQKQLEYPEILQGWNNWTNFCYLPPSPSLVVVCSNNHITELTIVGNRTAPSRIIPRPTPDKFSASKQTLSSSFSLDSFFTVLTKLSYLKKLSLVSLGLWGPFSSKINRLRSLEMLNVSSNFIYAEIPDTITSLQNLRSLVLADNLFNGSVGDLKTLQVLEELNLGYNYLGPEFPSLGSSLASIVLGNNSFKSKLPQDVKSFSQLQHFDVSYNGFFGPIPSSIFSLPSIQYLNFAQNRLNGTLPTSLPCNRNLSYVDISRNLLTGKLPSCIASNLTNHTVITSWNCLTSGNLKEQYPNSHCQKEVLAVDPPSSAPNKDTSIKFGLIIGIIVGTVAIAMVFSLLILVIIRRTDATKSSNKKFNGHFADELSFRGSPRSSIDTRRVPQRMRSATVGLPPYHVYKLEEIEDATDNFDACNLVGEASQEQIYKARLRDGSVVLVKCLKLKQKHLPQNLLQQVDDLSKLRHRNLVSVLGHCVVTYQDHPNVAGTIFIVLEHFSNGSLKDYLTDWRKREMLKWPQRMAIVMGIARGVQFLHTGIAPGIYGNDLKIENILLDDSLSAKVGNYKIPLPLKVGLEGPGSEQDSSDRPRSAKDAQREDVYQLGKILLQIIIGRLVISNSELEDSKQQLELSLSEHPSHLRNATDPSIRGTFAYQSLITAVEVAVNCLTRDPSKRPSIEDVLWNLQYSIQVQEGWTSSENLSTRT